MKQKHTSKDPSAPRKTNADWLAAREKEHLEMRQALNHRRLADGRAKLLSTQAPATSTE